jgi:hypothetical protein
MEQHFLCLAGPFGKDISKLHHNAERPRADPGPLSLIRRRPTLPRRCQRSTIGAGGLNFRVRDGNGCNPSARVTGNSGNSLKPAIRQRQDFKQGKFYGQASRPISTGKLHALPHFHTQPITWWSSRGLQHPYGWGYLFLGWVSRLYAFSIYPVRT